jgi:folate-binding protein YgfZ
MPKIAGNQTMPDNRDEHNTLIFPLSRRAGLVITGDEALDFLNDLLTLNIANIDADQVSPAALLTPQGRMLFDLMISQTDDGYRVECDADLMPALMQKLRLYRLRRPVEIAPFEGIVFAAFGAVEGAGWLKDTRFHSAGSEDQAWRRYGDLPPNHTADHQMTEDTYRAARYRLAIAEGNMELPSEKALPLEARWDDLGAISFDKGCFIGQEVTARTRYRGLLKRRYAPFTAKTSFPIPADIICDGRPVGEVLGLAKDTDGWTGLANIRLDAMESGKPLTAADTTISPLLPPISTIKA